jgi:hypothetical protein
MSCECESGKFGCGCCCASVTNMKGGIHPDSIETIHKDLVLTEQEVAKSRTFRTEVLLTVPGHVVGISVSLVATRRDENPADASQDKQLQQPSSGADGNITQGATASVSLFTMAGYTGTDEDEGGFNPPETSEQDRSYFWTAGVSSSMPTVQASEDVFGYFCDGGCFVELNAPTNDFGIRVVMRYIPRTQFTPAYHDPVDVMQHYWKCSHGDEEFLEGFYGGTSLDFSDYFDTSSPDPPGNNVGISWQQLHDEFTGGGSWFTF